MKYKIRHRAYHNSYPQLAESVLAVEARFFKIENGFVAAWFADRKTFPDIYINANDVLTIEPIEEEE